MNYSYFFPIIRIHIQFIFPCFRSSGEDEATQGLDLNSAFFAGTVNSVNKKLQSQKKNKKGGGVKPEEVEAVSSNSFPFVCSLSLQQFVVMKEIQLYCVGSICIYDNLSLVDLLPAFV